MPLGVSNRANLPDVGVEGPDMSGTEVAAMRPSIPPNPSIRGLVAREREIEGTHLGRRA